MRVEVQEHNGQVTLTHEDVVIGELYHLFSNQGKHHAGIVLIVMNNDTGKKERVYLEVDTGLEGRAFILELGHYTYRPFYGSITLTSGDSE